MALHISKNIHLHAQWQALQPLPTDNARALWQWIRLRFNHLSNSFEGNTLTYNETQMLLIHGRATGDHRLREYEEMKAHNVAFEHIRRLATEEQLIGETDIRDLNKICLKEPFYQPAQTPDGAPTRKRIVPGEYKKQPNHVITTTGDTFHFATPEETPALMAELSGWLREWLEQDRQQHEALIPFLAELHRRFIKIHPFDDGNGRVIRLLLSYILVRAGYLPMLLTDRDAYIKAVQFSDVGDMSHLENLFAEAVAMMLKKGIAAKERIIELNESEAE